MRGALARVWLAMLVFVAVGCTTRDFVDPLGREEALETAQKKYTDMVRWGDVVKAQKYVDPALRADFVRLAGAFEGLRITDAEIGEIEHQSRDAARVTVTYRGYALANLVERQVHEDQEWYRVAGLGNEWRVRPGLDEVLAAFEGHPAAATLESHPAAPAVP